MRNQNERVVITLVGKIVRIPKTEISKLTGLLAQTVSVIMLGLEIGGRVAGKEKSGSR
ncbi:MAG: hypothetical protein OXE85_14540 [Roseovarius sp.]|nr:hypothetical protein [Roseovarius sp.]